MNLLGKRGELTSHQIVVITILIISFIVILFLLFRLNLGEETQKEICHNSIILQDRSFFSGPLNCRTNYLCVSGGEDCEDINPMQTIEVDINPRPTQEKTEEDLIKGQIMKSIADEMSDCWWQFGEGKVDYTKGISGTHSCAVCSTVKFDSSLQNVDLTYGGFYEYLEKTKKGTSSEAYLKYLYGVTSLESLDISESYLNENFEFGERYAVITGMAKEGFSWSGFSIDIEFTLDIFGDDGNIDPSRIIRPVILKSSDIDSLNCGDFVTKA